MRKFLTAAATYLAAAASPALAANTNVSGTVDRVFSEANGCVVFTVVGKGAFAIPMYVYPEFGGWYASDRAGYLAHYGVPPALDPQSQIDLNWYMRGASVNFTTTGQLACGYPQAFSPN